ncbi:MAG TPA: glycosyltransferase family 39 protein [Tepidisphaeraceae bacterium]|nr:glycosyltransferase family 39 protein [Tepidisphaeraceae bacterium]
MKRRLLDHPWLLLMVILAIGAGTRIARCGFEGLTFDEQWHMELSTGRGSYHVGMPRDQYILQAPASTSLKGAAPVTAIWTHITYAVHPPLYFITLRIWREIFGEGDAPAQALSIFCSLIAIVLMFEAARRLNGLVPALWAALIFAVAPTQAWVDQLVRGYAMLQMVGMATVLALVMLKTSPDKSAIKSAALGVLALAMMLTHYFAIAPLLGVGVFVLIGLRSKARWQALTALVCAAIIYSIIWLPFMLRQRQDVVDADAWLKKEDAVKMAIIRTATWPWRLIADTGLEDHPQPWPYLSAAMFVLPLVFMRRRPDMLLWYVWMASALGFIGVLDAVRGTTNSRFARYVIQAGPAVFVLFAVLVSLLPKWLARPIPLALVAAALGMSWVIYIPEQGDLRPIGTFLDAHVTDSEPVIFYSGDLPEYFRGIYFLAGAHYSHQFPRPAMELSKPPGDALLRSIPHATAWVVSSPLPANGMAERFPSAQILEQYDLIRLATIAHIRLPTTMPATQP